MDKWRIEDNGIFSLEHSTFVDWVSENNHKWTWIACRAREVVIKQITVFKRNNGPEKRSTLIRKLELLNEKDDGLGPGWWQWSWQCDNSTWWNGPRAEAIRSLSAPLIGTEAPFNYNPPIVWFPFASLASFPSLAIIRFSNFFSTTPIRSDCQAFHFHLILLMLPVPAYTSTLFDDKGTRVKDHFLAIKNEKSKWQKVNK